MGIFYVTLFLELISSVIFIVYVCNTFLSYRKDMKIHVIMGPICLNWKNSQNFESRHYTSVEYGTRNIGFKSQTFRKSFSDSLTYFLDKFLKHSFSSLFRVCKMKKISPAAENNPSATVDFKKSLFWLCSFGAWEIFFFRPKMLEICRKSLFL